MRSTRCLQSGHRGLWAIHCFIHWKQNLCPQTRIIDGSSHDCKQIEHFRSLLFRLTEVWSSSCRSWSPRSRRSLRLRRFIGASTPCDIRVDCNTRADNDLCAPRWMGEQSEKSPETARPNDTKTTNATFARQISHRRRVNFSRTERQKSCLNHNLCWFLLITGFCVESKKVFGLCVLLN